MNKGCKKNEDAFDFVCLGIGIAFLIIAIAYWFN